MSTPGKRAAADRDCVRGLIEAILRECPERRSTSPAERRAQELIAAELERLGLKSRFAPFKFNSNLHANMALHFGLAVAGTVISGVLPAAGLLMHSVAAASYRADVSKEGYILRRLLRFRDAANLLAIAPARGPVKLRLVFVAHADAGFAGWAFDPRFVRIFEGGPKFIRRPLAFTTAATAALAKFDALRIAFGPATLPLRPIEWALTLPAVITLAMNVQILLADTPVPGANDNLSACAALPVLARRLMRRQPAGVELVFVVTACEEAALGGSDALAREMDGRWEKDRTVVIALDAITNGALHYLEAEGEVKRFVTPRWLCETAEDVARETGLPGGIGHLEPPAGGSDAGPFAARGFDAIALSCIDPALGTPRHYHHPDDTLENLEMDQLMRSIDFAESLAGAIVAARLR